MHILVLIFALLIAAPLAAQPAPPPLVPGYPPGVTAPLFIVASGGAVSGGGTVNTSLCFNAANPDVGLERASANVIGVTNCSSTTYATLGSSGLTLDLAGVRASAADGVLTLLGLGNGADENLTFDFDNAGANTVALASGTSAATLTSTLAIVGPAGTASAVTFGLGSVGTGIYSGSSGVDFSIGGARQGGVNSAGTLSISNVIPTGVVSVGDRGTVTVNGATTFATNDSYIVLTCTGAESIETITGNAATLGVVLWIEHTSTDCTLVDDDTPAANALNLVGSANNVGAAGKVIALIYNGTFWLQVGQSINN